MKIITRFVFCFFLIFVTLTGFLNLDLGEGISSILILAFVYSSSLLIVIMVYFISGKIKNLLNPFSVFFVAYWGISLISTVLHTDSPMIGMANLLIGLSSIALLMWQFREDSQFTLKFLCMLFGIYNIVNLLSILIFPEGIYLRPASDGGLVTAYFYGIGNSFVRIQVPSLVLIIVFSYLEKHKITFFALIQIVITIISLLLGSSATGLVAIVFFAVMVLIVSYFKKFPIRFFYVVFLAAYILVFFIICVYQLTDSELMAYFVRDILQKDLTKNSITLTGRTKIWAEAVHMIKDSIVLGYGYISDNKYILLSISKNGIKNMFLIGPHNMIFLKLLHGGIVGLSAFLLAVIASQRYLIKYASYHTAKIVAIGFCAFLISVLTENDSFLYEIILLSMAYNFEYILKNTNPIAVIARQNGLSHIAERKGVKL